MKENDRERLFKEYEKNKVEIEKNYKLLSQVENKGSKEKEKIEDKLRILYREKINLIDRILGKGESIANGE